jgi:stage II sporulation protein D
MQRFRFLFILLSVAIVAFSGSGLALADNIVDNVETYPIIDGEPIERVEYVDPVEVVQASSSNSGATFTFTGDGWGHRIGMSQYGARGMAQDGKNYEQILKHYYQGIKLGTREDRDVRVMLSPSEIFSIEPNSNYKLYNADNNEEVSFTGKLEFSQKSNKVVVKVNDQEITSDKGFELKATNNSNDTFAAVSQVTQGTSTVDAQYRGSFIIGVGNNQPTLTNELKMEDYLRGVVPNEMPASWNLEALKAQAIAARTYAHVQVNSNSGTLVDTVADQVYKGKATRAHSDVSWQASEYSRSDDAIKQTVGEVALDNNNILINAVFHASSGGHTENSENVWTSSVSYLKGVDDSYDTATSPFNNWQVIVPNATIARAVFGTTDIMVENIQITKRTDAGSVQEVKVTGKHKSTGKAHSVVLPSGNADGLRSAFGVSLRSIKFDVERNDIFTDVTNTFSGFEEIMFLYGRDVITGYPDNSFRPNQTITRVQTARMLDRELKLSAPPSSYNLKATDISSDQSYYELFRKMEYHGIMTGSNGKMNPGGDLTRAQMAAVLTRAFNLTKPDSVTFSYADINRNTYNQSLLKEIDTIAYHGLTTEHGDRAFRPNQSTNRVQFSRFMTRAIDESFR